MTDRSSDPFAQLGLGPDATAHDVRSARRRLAKDRHPDAGGSTAAMAAVNSAATRALSALDQRRVPPPPDPPLPDAARPDTPAADGRGRNGPDARWRWHGVATDAPSFTVEALPVDTFEALLVVASWIGEVLDDDPPYRLDVHLYEPAECWCRLDVVPDAGASTVSLTVGAVGDGSAPDVEQVRDVWVASLNQLDWD